MSLALLFSPQDITVAESFAVSYDPLYEFEESTCDGRKIKKIPLLLNQEPDAGRGFPTKCIATTVCV